MSRGMKIGALVGLAALLAVVAAGCGGSSSKKATALPASACSDIYYQGSGSPQYLISSDLPLQGSGRTQTVQMTQAIQYVLKQANFKAGKYSIGYQSCDDSTATAGKWDSAKCASNANDYANNNSVIGVIGTFNSGCAEIEIPVLNRAPNGPVGMISPANTYVGLTHKGPGTAPGEPEKYYPTGKRNYVRIVAADDFQGAADALNAQGLKLTKIWVLNDKEAYGQGVATNFSNAAKQLGLKVVGFTSWDGKATSYQGIATQIKSSGADAVFIGGLICENGGKLVKDLRATLGTGVTLLAPDGFTPVSAVVQGAGTAANGMYISVAGVPERAARCGWPDVREGLRRDAVGRHRRPVLDVCRAGGSRAAVVDRRFGRHACRRRHAAPDGEGDQRAPGHVLDQQERRHDLEPGHAVQGRERRFDHLQGDHAAAHPRPRLVEARTERDASGGGREPSPRANQPPE